ncbi:MAG: ABC transporter permease [Christensenellaceae bacterium]|nr:ABC transporter permease [Christensenellaceae bacterium]
MNKEKLKKLMVGSFGTFVLLLLLLTVFTILSDIFMSKGNITNLLIQSGTNAIIAVGMTFIIMSGNIDISVGAILAMSSCLGARIMVDTNNIILGSLVALLVGIALGLFNGYLVAYLKFQPFIVTLSTMWLYRGMAYLYTGGMSIVGMPRAFTELGRGKMFALPNVVWLMIILYIICYFILQKTTFGRKVCAIGDNKEAARLSGINVKRTTLVVFAMSGFFAALSGLVYMSRLNSGQPIAGQSYEMYAIAAAVIGGASLIKGGIGNLIGTLIGAIFIAALQNGLTILNVGTYWQQVFMGLVVLLAVAVDRLRKL